VKTQETEIPIRSDNVRTAANAQRFLLAGSGAGKYWLVAGVALLATLLYVGVASIGGESGLPLDDSWIHQTYARNLIQNGNWSYVNGVISAGSTAPLWTLLLAFGYLFRLPFLPWAYFLGWLCLTWIGWSGMRLWADNWVKQEHLSWLVGVVIVLTWPLVWAAGSGMETLLFCGLAMQLMVSYGRQQESGHWQSWVLGILAGFLILTRPDGLPLAILIAGGILISLGSPKDKFIRTALYLITAVLPLIPYFLLNYVSNNTLWPNTYYAKQSEYAFLWEVPLVQRYVKLLYHVVGGPLEGLRGISGAHLLLLPGIFVSSWCSLRADWQSRRLLRFLPILWAAGHVFLYAWRLPVNYQHGRYLMPVIPVIILYGLAGWIQLGGWIKDRLQISQRSENILRTFAGLTFIALLLIFFILGLQAYKQDVALINGEMVTTARWIQANTPENALIAAHDIGAIGYFANRHILDLAGLISPEVIPLLADKEGMAAYVLQSEADYLVTAPGWPYTSLTSSDQVDLLFSTEFAWTQSEGYNNMEVYKLGS